jgi:hypothetical protein
VRRNKACLPGNVMRGALVALCALLPVRTYAQHTTSEQQPNRPSPNATASSTCKEHLFKEKSGSEAAGQVFVEDFGDGVDTGRDSSEALQRALNCASDLNSAVQLKAGIYLIGQQIIMPKVTRLYGAENASRLAPSESASLIKAPTNILTYDTARYSNGKRGVPTLYSGLFVTDPKNSNSHVWLKNFGIEFTLTKCLSSSLSTFAPLSIIGIFGVRQDAHAPGGAIQGVHISVQEDPLPQDKRSCQQENVYPQISPIWILGEVNHFEIVNNEINLRAPAQGGGSIWLSSINNYDMNDDNQVSQIIVRGNTIFHNSQDEALGLFSRQGQIRDITIDNNRITSGPNMKAPLVTTHSVVDRPYLNYAEGAYYDRTTAAQPDQSFQGILSEGCADTYFARMQSGPSNHDNPDEFLLNHKEQCPSPSAPERLLPAPLAKWVARYYPDIKKVVHGGLTKFKANAKYIAGDEVVLESSPGHVILHSFYKCSAVTSCAGSPVEDRPDSGWRKVVTGVQGVTISKNIFTQASAFSGVTERVGRDIPADQFGLVKDVYLLGNTYNKAGPINLPSGQQYFHIYVASHADSVSCLTIRKDGSDANRFMFDNRLTLPPDASNVFDAVPPC